MTTWPDGGVGVRIPRISVVPATEQEHHEKLFALQINALECLNLVGQHSAKRGDDMEGFLAIVAKAAIALTNADKCTVQVFDESIGALKLVAHQGFEEPFLQFFEVVTTQAAACELAMRSRSRVVVP